MHAAFLWISHDEYFGKEAWYTHVDSAIVISGNITLFRFARRNPSDHFAVSILAKEITQLRNTSA